MIRSINTLACTLLGVLIVLWQNDLRELLLIVLLVPWDKLGNWAGETFDELAEMRRARKAEVDVHKLERLNVG
jgi:hypothetical protein